MILENSVRKIILRNLLLTLIKLNMKVTPASGRDWYTVDSYAGGMAIGGHTAFKSILGETYLLISCMIFRSYP